MTRGRAADDFDMIRRRLEELRQERLPAQPTGGGSGWHRGPCACGMSLFPDECDGCCKAL
jgi:hypothetical protein